MQFNQPINSVFHNDQIYPFATPLPYTDIKGEGDVVSLMLPDGSVQFYFIPTYRRDRRFSYSYNPATFNDLGPWPVGTEAWFIKRISSPSLPSYMQEKIPHIGDPFLRSYYTSEGSEHFKSSQNPYYQKFHNDNVTSTTDIHYFYPNQRQTHLKLSASAQVEVPSKYNGSCQTEDVYNSCFCTTKKNKHKMFRYNNMIDSSSAMSIDSQTQTSRKRQKNSKVRFKSPYKSKTREYCSCNQTTVRNENDKADKMISTYTDRATSCVDSDGQETQTLSTKDSQNSNKTEILKLNKSKSLMSCDSCCDTCYYCKTDCSSDCCE